jgi:hypothetical protein
VSPLARLFVYACIRSLLFTYYASGGARYADGVFADEYSITGSEHYVNKHHKNY